MLGTKRLMVAINFYSTEKNTMEVNGYRQLFDYQHSPNGLLLCSTEERNAYMFETSGGGQNFNFGDVQLIANIKSSCNSSLPFCSSLAQASRRAPAITTTDVVPSPASISWALDSSTIWNTQETSHNTPDIHWESSRSDSVLGFDSIRLFYWCAALLSLVTSTLIM